MAGTRRVAWATVATRAREEEEGPMTEQQPPQDPNPNPQFYSPPPGVVPGAPEPAAPPAYQPPPSYQPPPQPAYTPPGQQAGYAPVPSTEYTPPPQTVQAAQPAYAPPVFGAPAVEAPPAPPAAPARPTGIAAFLPAGMSTTMAGIYAGLAVAGVLALFIGFLWYNAAAKKDTDQRIAAANKTMSQVVKNEAKVGDNLRAAFEPPKGPVSPPKNYNGDSIRQAITDVTPALDAAAKTVATDQSTMQAASSKFNDRGFLSFTSGDKLDQKSAQMEALTNALGVRADEAATAKQQLTLLADLTKAQENFSGLAEALDKQDLITATSRYTPARNAINQAVTDAQQSNTPDALRTYVNNVSNFMDATQSVINALQNRDYGQFTEALRVFTTQLENIGSYDPKTMRQQYDDLTKSYDDRYNSYLHDAGFLTGTKAV